MNVVRPYGDTTGDGRVQLSFTLPLPTGDAAGRARAEGAALQLAAKMGMDQAMVVHAKAMGPDFTFFIVYGRVSHVVDVAAVTVTEREFPLLSPQEVNLRIRSALGRKLVVVGACVGTDAHTVGIDAILNVKGHAGEKGLEYYREMRVINLGAQVSVGELADRARREHADAVLVSQVVTQRDAHLTGARALAEAFAQPEGLRRPGAASDLPGNAAGPPLTQYPTPSGTGPEADPAQPSGVNDGEGQGSLAPAILQAGRIRARPLLIVGGPRFDPAMAADLGVDRIFGRGTTPDEVASYLVHALAAPGASGGNGGDAGTAGTGTADAGVPGTGIAGTADSGTGPGTGVAGTGVPGTSVGGTGVPGTRVAGAADSGTAAHGGVSP